MADQYSEYSVVPTIQPEETIHSAVLRLGRLNGVTDSVRLFKELLPAKTKLTAVSAIFDRSPSNLRRNHTLSPLIDLFDVDANEFDEPEATLHPRSHRLSCGYRTNLKFCPECVVTDQGSLGFSYWRRAHQLPDVDYCWEHKIRLRNTNTSNYHCLPHEIPLSEACNDCPIPSNSNLEERYNQLLQRILEEPIRLDKSQMLGVLRERTKVLGYSTTEYNHGGTRPPLSAYIDKHYGDESGLSGQQNLDLVNATKTAAIYLHGGNIVPQRCLLLAAALSRSLDDAFSLIADRTPRRSKARHDISEHHFRRAYIDGKWERMAMAKILGVTSDNVRILFRPRPYIELHESTSPNTLRALIAFSNGQRLLQACETHGATLEAVEIMLREGTRYASMKIQQILPNLA